MPNKREESISLAEFAAPGHCWQMSAEPMSESNSDAMDNARKPDSIVDKRRKKKPAYLVGKQAGVLRIQVIEREKGELENPENLDH